MSFLNTAVELWFTPPMQKTLRTIEWIGAKSGALLPGRVRMIDQTRLPEKLVWCQTADVRKIWAAIKTLQVRGAPAIGIAAAMGVVAAVQQSKARTGAELVAEVERAADYLATSRPTAVNLFWALDQMRRHARAQHALTPAALKGVLVRAAMTIRDEDAAMCRAIGQHVDARAIDPFPGQGGRDIRLVLTIRLQYFDRPAKHGPTEILHREFRRDSVAEAANVGIGTTHVRQQTDPDGPRRLRANNGGHAHGGGGDGAQYPPACRLWHGLFSSITASVLI